MIRDTTNSAMFPMRDRRHGQQALHHVQVGDGPADQLPGADLVLARAVQAGQRAEQPGPQVVLDVEGQPAAVVAAQVDAGEVHRGRDQQQPGQRPDRLLVGHDDVVDDAALDQRDRGCGRRARQRAGDRDDDVARITPAVARQPPQPPVSRARASAPSLSSLTVLPPHLAVIPVEAPTTRGVCSFPWLTIVILRGMAAGRDAARERRRDAHELARPCRTSPSPAGHEESVYQVAGKSFVFFRTPARTR